MDVKAGTSGFSYKEWKGSFYPEDLSDGDMLRYYAGRLPTVEINNTFYRMPKESVLRDWVEQAGGDFTFAIKASRRITHQHRLKGAEDPLEYLVGTCRSLETCLGSMLFQLPPYLKKDVERLEGFLALLPEGWPAAFEFRHESWFDDDVYEALRGRNAALVVADTEDGATPLVPTADWGYLRLRRMDYDPGALEEWAAQVTGQPWERAFVYFKHEDEGTGPRLAASFTEAVEARG